MSRLSPVQTALRNYTRDDQMSLSVSDKLGSDASLWQSCRELRAYQALRPSVRCGSARAQGRALAAATSDFSALVTLAPNRAPNLFNPNGHIDQTLACSSSTSPNRTARYRRCSGLGRGRRVSSSKNDLSFTPRALPMCHSATTVGVRWPNSRPVT